jgi:hypothetical protein
MIVPTATVIGTQYVASLAFEKDPIPGQRTAFAHPKPRVQAGTEQPSIVSSSSSTNNLSTSQPEALRLDWF